MNKESRRNYIANNLRKSGGSLLDLSKEGGRESALPVVEINLNPSFKDVLRTNPPMVVYKSRARIEIDDNKSLNTGIEKRGERIDTKNMKFDPTMGRSYRG